MSRSHECERCTQECVRHGYVQRSEIVWYKFIPGTVA
jgi:hypothetical protein